MLRTAKIGYEYETYFKKTSLLMSLSLIDSRVSYFVSHRIFRVVLKRSIKSDSKEVSKMMTLFRSRFVGLNKHHAYFLLVDNGTVGKYGAEIALRRKLEKFISTQRLSADFSTPLVCLVIEGGTNTIRAVLEYVTDSPPVPVVVCDGTGRAADLIAFAHKYAGEDGQPGLLDDMHDQLRVTIQKTFDVSAELAGRLLIELVQCVKRKNLVSLF